MTWRIHLSHQPQVGAERNSTNGFPDVPRTLPVFVVMLTARIPAQRSHRDFSWWLGPRIRHRRGRWVSSVINRIGSIAFCDGLKTLLDLILRQGSEFIVRTLLSISSGPTDNADLQFALLEVHTQDGAEGADA